MIHYRPHHFMCTMGFIGKGYSPEFIKNFNKITSLVQRDDTTPIEVVFETDSVCEPCPHKLGTDLCRYQGKIKAIDQAHSEILNLKNGEILSWRQAKERIRKKMTLKNFHKACKDCSWKGMGVCETALRKLKSKSTTV